MKLARLAATTLGAALLLLMNGCTFSALAGNRFAGAPENNAIPRGAYHQKPTDSLFLGTYHGIAAYDAAHLNRRPSLIPCRSCYLSAFNETGIAVFQEWYVSSRLVEYDLRRNKRLVMRAIEPATMLAWSRGRLYLADSSTVRTLGRNLTPLRSVRLPLILNAAVSPSGRVALATKHGIRVLNADLQYIATVPVNTSLLAFDRQGDLFVVDGLSANIRIFDRSLRQVAAQTFSGRSLHSIAAEPFFPKTIAAALFSTDRGVYIAGSDTSLCDDGGMTLYRVEREKAPQAVATHLSHVDAVAFDPHGKLIVSESACGDFAPVPAQTIVFDSGGKPLIRLTGSGKVDWAFLTGTTGT